ncbi:MAG TPA: sialidase family protein [Candidatus Dormibacteraeota bacterium]|nr:sialidase family protein [Candidatus Dormibacteraeota bacterium]
MRNRVAVYAWLCTCVTLVAFILGAAGKPQAAQGPPSMLGVPCAQVYDLGIDKQENLRATLIMVGCGLSAAGDPDAPATTTDSFTADAFLNTNLITGAENYPHITQSESMVWSKPDGTTIVVNYNDSADAPVNYSGVSVSTDGGATFNRLMPSPFATGHGTNFGDPIVVYNALLATWFGGDLATGCGGQGIGLWSSADALNWDVGACAHSGTSDDRQSMWVDNNSASPFYGRMYISWNDFSALGGQALFVTYSDDGNTWTAPNRLSIGFIRNIQLTGSPQDGTVFVAAMNEGGGQLNPRTNYIYRSLDGGGTWTQIRMGDPFVPPGDTGCNYFAKIQPIWRHMGWGQPAVGPGGVVHYVFSGRGSNPGDKGDIFYTQSLDNGVTWSAPIVLNSDQASGSATEQWMPSISVTTTGTVLVGWYDRRNTTDGANYEYWGIQSLDNGTTWQPDAPLSDGLIAQPEQVDPNMQACYAGDYNYHSALDNVNFATWTDGRNAISGHFQQDVYFTQSATTPPVRPRARPVP